MMFTSLILVAGILGSLGVTVLDEEENLIPGASVELVQDDRVERRAVTNQATWLGQALMASLTRR